MANMRIVVDGGTVTISCDEYDWTSLMVNGKTTTCFPAQESASGTAVSFLANYTPGSPAVPQAPMVLYDQSGNFWLAVIDFSSDGNGGCNVRGAIQPYQGQVAPASQNPLLFSAIGLTGEFQL